MLIRYLTIGIKSPEKRVSCALKKSVEHQNVSAVMIDRTEETNKISLRLSVFA